MMRFALARAVQTACATAGPVRAFTPMDKTAVTDILGTQVERPQMRETTALGAAYLAGLACGFWGSLDELRGKAVIERKFEPTLDETAKEKLYAGWKKAVSRTRDWEPHEGAE